MTRHNKETGAVNDFWDFLKQYFQEDEIIHHPETEINAQEEKKPDFLIKINEIPKILFEFKELEKSQKEGSARDIFIKYMETPHVLVNSSRFLPDRMEYWIAWKIKIAAEQLKLAERLKCPCVVVICTKVHSLQTSIKIDDAKFTDAMYRIKIVDLSTEPYSHISAVAYFEVNTDDISVIKYRIKFFHNKFAKYKMSIDSLNDKNCHHFDLDNNFSSWKPRLD